MTAVDALFGRIESVEGPLGKYRIHGGNAGPQGYRCTNEYFKARVQGYLHRINFAAAKARKMGYHVDPYVWLRHTGWKLKLARHILYRNGELPDRVPFWGIVLSPLREANANFPMGLLRCLMLAVVRLAPSEIGLRLGHRMLDKSWGRALVPVSIPAQKIQD